MLYAHKCTFTWEFFFFVKIIILNLYRKQHKKKNQVTDNRIKLPTMIEVLKGHSKLKNYITEITIQ